jgi:hypothetical protein
MTPLTAPFDAAALGRRHALMRLRCAGVVYAVIDQVAYEIAYAEALTEPLAAPQPRQNGPPAPGWQSYPPAP